MTDAEKQELGKALWPIMKKQTLQLLELSRLVLELGQQIRNPSSHPSGSIPASASSQATTPESQ
jgi:hypothetical protein